MIDLDPTTLQQIAEKAAEQAAKYPRWLSAIARAIVEISDNPYLCRNPNGHGVIIGSASGQAYAANGRCDCTAFTGILNGKRVHAGGLPCYHRAIARIIRLCDEREAAAQIEGIAIINAQQAGILTMPEGDTLDTDGMRVQRKIAAARATALVNELFA